MPPKGFCAGAEEAGLDLSLIHIFLALLRKIILLIPLIYILPNFFEDKVFAVFLAEPVSDTLAVLTTVSLFAYQFKRLLSQLDNEKAAATH